MTIILKGMTPNPPAIAADGGMPFTQQQILEHLRLVRKHVPDFGPLTVAESSPLHPAANVPNDLIEEAINTIGASTAIEAALGRTPEVLRTELEDAVLWSAVESELRTLLSGVAAANLARRYRLGLTALQTYSIARQLVRQKEHADLLPHVDAMRRLNRFGRKRRPASSVSPPLVPAPAPAPKAP